MRKKHNAHQQDIDDLKRQNNLLESQIRALEKTKYTGNFASQTMSNDSALSPSRTERSGMKFDGSASDTSDSEINTHSKRMKT
ncbi:Protein max [Armadillidium vulgare]|nr:Protein max [Armadillidium vulgare]